LLSQIYGVLDILVPHSMRFPSDNFHAFWMWLRSRGRTSAVGRPQDFLGTRVGDGHSTETVWFAPKISYYYVLNKWSTYEVRMYRSWVIVMLKCFSTCGHRPLVRTKKHSTLNYTVEPVRMPSEFI
jgi:hypothetical protein